MLPAFAGLIDIAHSITFSLTARSCAMFDTYASFVASSLDSSCDLVAVCDLLDRLGINYVQSVPLWFITLREPTKHPWYGTARFWDWSSIPPKGIVSGMNSNRPVSSSVIKQIEQIDCLRKIASDPSTIEQVTNPLSMYQLPRSIILSIGRSSF